MTEQQIYDKFIKSGKIQAKYVNIEEFKVALQRGRAWYGTKDWGKYLRKSYKRAEIHHKIHTGTMVYVDTIVKPKIKAEQEAVERRIREAAAREKQELTAKFNQTQKALNDHKQKLVNVKQQIDALNKKIDTMNKEKTEDLQKINKLNEQITKLQTSLQNSTNVNRELIQQISTLQIQSQKIQIKLIEKIMRIEEFLVKQREFNGMIISANMNINTLAQTLQCIKL